MFSLLDFIIFIFLFNGSFLFNGNFLGLMLLRFGIGIVFVLLRIGLKGRRVFKLFRCELRRRFLFLL